MEHSLEAEQMSLPTNLPAPDAVESPDIAPFDRNETANALNPAGDDVQTVTAEGLRTEVTASSGGEDATLRSSMSDLSLLSSGHSSHGSIASSRSSARSRRSMSLSAFEGENPDIVLMLKGMSLELRARRSNVGRYVLLLLVSSPIWSEEKLQGLRFLRSAQLVELLEEASLVPADGRSSQDVLLSFYREVVFSFPSSNQAFTVSVNEARSRNTATGTLVRTATANNFRHTVVDTGRRDHRGMTIL